MIKNKGKRQKAKVKARFFCVFFALFAATFSQNNPPNLPTLHSVASNERVMLYWDNSAEISVDSTLMELYPDEPEKWNDFEGYRIYRSRNHTFDDIQTITDGFGTPIFYNPIEQYDIANDTEGYFEGNGGFAQIVKFSDNSENVQTESMPPFYPDLQPVESFSGLLETGTVGDWILRITDADSSKNAGYVKQWKLRYFDEDSTVYVDSSRIDFLENARNRDFEGDIGNDGYPKSWTTWEVKENIDVNILDSLKIEMSDNAFEGENAVALTLYGGYEDSTNQEMSQSMTQRLTDLVPGETYTLSAMIYDTSSLASAQLWFIEYHNDPPFQPIRSSIGVGTFADSEWQKLELEFTLSYFYTVGEIEIEIFHELNNTPPHEDWQNEATILVDDIHLVGNGYWGEHKLPVISDTLQIAENIEFTSVELSMKIEHRWSYELQMELFSPNGNSMKLFDGNLPKSYLDATNGVNYYLGDNSGLQYIWTDTTVQNGLDYFYAVAAYDHGDTQFNQFPAETPIDIRIENGDYVFSENTIMARPQRPVDGFIPGGMKGEISHDIGVGTGVVFMTVVDSTRLKNDSEYELSFFDTATDSIDNIAFYTEPTSFNLINYAEDDTLCWRCEPPSGKTPIFDGFYLTILNETDVKVNADSVKWRGNREIFPPLSVFNLVPVNPLAKLPSDFEIVFYDSTVQTSRYWSNWAIGELDSIPVNFRLFDKITGDEYQVGAIYENDNLNAYFFVPEISEEQDTTWQISWYFEIKENNDDYLSDWDGGNGGVEYWVGDTSFVVSSHTWGLDILTDIEATEIGDTVSLDFAKSSDVQCLRFIGNLESTNLGESLILETGFGEQFEFEFPTEMIEIDTIISLENSDSTNLSLCWIPNQIGAITLGEIQMIEYFPYGAGDTLFVPTTKPFTSADQFSFQTQSSRWEQCETDFTNIKVVPNPWVVGSSFGERIDFVGVPKDCEIHIFTIEGKLVQTLNQDGNILNDSVSWNLRNSMGQKIAYGVYIFQIKSGKENFVGKLAIIR